MRLLSTISSFILVMLFPLCSNAAVHTIRSAQDLFDACNSMEKVTKEILNSEEFSKAEYVESLICANYIRAFFNGTEITMIVYEKALGKKSSRLWCVNDTLNVEKIFSEFKNFMNNNKQYFNQEASAALSLFFIEKYKCNSK